LYCNALAFICAGGGAELAVADSALNIVKHCGNGIHAAGITYQYDLIGQLLRLEVQMEAGSVTVYD
jgi:hypothetical protein